MVVAGVLPGVVDHGQRLHRRAEVPVAGDEFVDDSGELGDVGTVAGIGVRQYRHSAVAGHDQRQADQPQVHTLLFRFTALGDRGAVVGGVDVGGEVGHVQHQPRQVQPELGDHPPSQFGFDAPQCIGVEAVHRVPEPAVIQRPGRCLHPPRPGRAGPPVGERRLRAWRHDPVCRGQRDIGAHRRPGIGVPRGLRVDDLRDVETVQDRPHRRQVPELFVLGTHRFADHSTGQFGHHFLGGPQILLRHDARLTVHPRGFHQVVVRLVTLALTHNRRHI
ncbi:MAG: hypothetical protein MUP13_08830 [Thermoanaerobaculales bacterium]|nr:hypothetical protein [Thermoanaerobaculales bacterium]